MYCRSGRSHCSIPPVEVISASGVRISPQSEKILEYYSCTYACDKCEKDTGFAHIVTTKMPLPLMKHSLASPSTVAEAFDDMKLENWISCYVHAYAYFGGVTRLLVPDNLKIGITKNTRYETVLKRLYEEITSKILFEEVFFETAAVALQKIIDSGIFPIAS